MNIFIRVKLYFSETFPFSKVLKFKWTGILFNDSQLVMFSYTGTLYTNVLLYNNKFCGIFIVSLSLDFVILLRRGSFKNCSSQVFGPAWYYTESVTLGNWMLEGTKLRVDFPGLCFRVAKAL